MGASRVWHGRDLGASRARRRRRYHGRILAKATGLIFRRDQRQALIAKVLVVQRDGSGNVAVKRNLVVCVECRPYLIGVG